MSRALPDICAVPPTRAQTFGQAAKKIDKAEMELQDAPKNLATVDLAGAIYGFANRENSDLEAAITSR